MLKKLIGSAPDSEISIVGSGPSATQFNGQGDLSIAVNGAALLDRQFDFFLYGDRQAPHRIWSKVDCARTRIVARHVATTDELLYPHDVAAYQDLERTTEPQSADQPNLPDPISPHIHFEYQEFSANRIAETNEFLMYGGTISCCAAQLAMIMGAKKIRLFGCEFSHARGSYFRKFRHVGQISNRQLETMNEALRVIRSKRIEVVAHGATKLTQVDQKIPTPSNSGLRLPILPNWNFRTELARYLGLIKPSTERTSHQS